MFETVEIPAWAIWVAGALAVVALLDRILIPSVRWYLKRRLDRAIEQLNERLQTRIQPFKLTRRQVMVDRLAHDPKVLQAIVDYAAEENVPFKIAEGRAERYAREIVPSFSAFTYFSFGIKASRWLSEALFKVRLGHEDEEALQAVDPDDTVVFVMNHKSNMDYILVTYLAASRSALSYAVGEWASVWPLKQLVRSTGAYFIRRKSRNALYRKVLARYVQMATEAGVAQAIFPEGGLSRDGAIHPPKLGILNYIVSGFSPTEGRDVVFIPVGLNYDRVLEDRVLLSMGRKERASFWAKVRGGVRVVVNHLLLRLTGRFRRFGYASVSFGTPISLRGFLKGQDDVSHEALTKNLGRSLMQNVARAVPVMPVPVVAAVLEPQIDKKIGREELHRESMAKLDWLIRKGASLQFTREEMDGAIAEGIRHLMYRGILEQGGDDGPLHVDPEQRDLVHFYANSIAHLGQAAKAVKPAKRG
jgi:glycerol-3-phosphate O-acyltransferase